MTMKIGTRILAGYGIGLLVFLTVGVVSYRSTTALVASADSVAHTHRVKEALAAVRGNLLNAETGSADFCSPAPIATSIPIALGFAMWMAISRAYGN